MQDAIALRRTAAVLGRVVNAKKKSVGIDVGVAKSDAHFGLMGKNGG